ncbi:MAG: sulfotransferase [Acidimicrobiales bacterium]
MFVVGCPRSGTTWVRDIFSQPPSTIAGKETHIYQDVLAPMLKLGLASGDGWPRVLFHDARHRRRGTGGHLHAWLSRPEVEDLVVRAMALERAGASAASLLDFVGLEHSPTFLDRVATAVDFSTHERAGDGEFHRKGIVGDWANVFTADDEALFRELAGDLFIEAGYRF